MTTIKETKYLIFATETIAGRKTKIVHIINKSNEHRLATIEWYGAWRQYCFYPTVEFYTVWNNTCLTDIIEVLNRLNTEQKFNQSNKKGE